MTQKEFKIEVVTPMFISGSDQKKSELRAPSIKGVLRWWWRSLNSDKSLDQLKENEEKIFGSTSNKSSFKLFLENINIQTALEDLPKGTRVEVEGKSYKASIIDYLAFGVSNKGKYIRPHIKPNSLFKIKFLFYDKFEEEILNAFAYMIKYGGFGSKSRNGFGSCSLQNKPDNKEFGFNNTKGGYHSFSNETKIFLFGRHSNWVEALSEIGKIYREARLKLEASHVYVKRLLIAKPIVQDYETKHDRHAKPFFLHVDKIDNKYQGKILFMPYNYYEPEKLDEYDAVMKKMCDYLKDNAREVKNVF